MKKIIKICSILIWFNLCFFVWVFTQANDYEYKNLDIKANVKIDWTMDITETFTANFLKKKHWIVRFIPLDYSVWNDDFHIDLDYIRVDWNKFSTFIDNRGMNIKIWDPDVEVKWEHIYPISYSAYWLIRNFSWMWYSELYRNLVWNDFDTNINEVKADIKLPKKYNKFKDSDFMITVDWKTKTIDQFQWTVDWDLWDEIIISYNKKLYAWEWITLAIKFPNDYFEFDHEKQAGLIWKSSEYVNNWHIFGLFVKLFDNAPFLWNVIKFIREVILFIIVIIIAWFLNKLWLLWDGGNEYDNDKWFGSWSVFSWWGKYFKKWWWGGWWGSRSW